MKRTLYLVFWGNGFVGAFDSEDFEQEFNTPTNALGEDLQRIWARGEYSDIKIITHDDLQSLRVENGYEKKMVL